MSVRSDADMAPRVAHHVFTLTTMGLCVTMIEYTQSTSYIVTGFLWYVCAAGLDKKTLADGTGYSRRRRSSPLSWACTDVSFRSFVAELPLTQTDRMNWDTRKCAWILKVAAIQTLVFKVSHAVDRPSRVQC